jgi:uncharacterized protein YbbK (DUF523 family)/uncharacterized protein YbgA (DUF1722 family)
MNFPRPKVVVSKCLGFEACRYNGQKIRDHSVDLLAPYVEFMPVCPEVEIGLGVPRDPVRVVCEEGGSPMLYQPATGRDVTGQMLEFTSRFFSQLEQPDGFILKHRSPSCGPWDVKSYSSKENPGAAGKGRGLFGAAVLQRLPDLPVEDEGRLRNFTIREHFFTTLFTLARFREQERTASGIRSLVNFHTEAKLLLMAYNQSAMRRLGKITANHERHPAEKVWELYGRELVGVFDSPPKFTNMINAFQHAFGGMSDRLAPGERRFFLNTLEEYRDERVPASTVIHLLKSWAVRFDNRYLLGQLLMEPYPHDLLEITDSGKGRSY